MKTFLMVFFFCSAISAKIYTVKTYDSHEGKSMLFSPEYLKIEVGDEVKFIPQSKGHTSKSIFTPKGAEIWDSETSEEIVVKFKKEGVYIYDCRNHGVMGMLGAIEVGRPINKKAAVSFYTKHKKNMVMNKNRLDTYFRIE